MERRFVAANEHQRSRTRTNNKEMLTVPLYNGQKTRTACHKYRRPNVRSVSEKALSLVTQEKPQQMSRRPAPEHLTSKGLVTPSVGAVKASGPWSRVECHRGFTRMRAPPSRDAEQRRTASCRCGFLAMGGLPRNRQEVVIPASCLQRGVTSDRGVLYFRNPLATGPSFDYCDSLIIKLVLTQNTQF